MPEQEEADFSHYFEKPNGASSGGVQNQAPSKNINNNAKPKFYKSKLVQIGLVVAMAFGTFLVVWLSRPHSKVEILAPNNPNPLQGSHNLPPVPPGR